MTAIALFNRPRRVAARLVLGLGLLGLGLGASRLAASEIEDDAPAQVELPAGQGFALVELFTSEGCANCPPADRLLGRIRAEARRRGQPVETLAFHVDYWNGLGGKDPWSSAAASRRQRWYGGRIEPHRVYTPQLVVNGTAAFVGADAATADEAIGAALAGPGGEGGIDLAVTPGGTQALVVDYRLAPGGAPAGSTLVLAWAQDTAQGQPTRGGNARHRFDHTGVVRDFRVLGGSGGLPEAGRVTLRRPDVGPGRVVGFLQDRTEARVTALAGVEVP